MFAVAQAIRQALCQDYDHHMQKVNSHCAFFAANQRKPKVDGVFPKERLLGVWHSCVRLAEHAEHGVGHAYHQMDEKLKAQVLAVDPAFFLY
jgi:hypothetical protein